MLTAGDNLLHSGLLRDGQEQKKDGADFFFDSFYENVKAQVSAADYAIINQESLVLPKRYLSNNVNKYFRSDGSFVSPPEILDTLTRLGFDAIDMANNHALDMGSAGLQWAQDYLNTRDDLLYFGAFYDQTDRDKIRIIEVNGIRVALLAYTYGTNVSKESADKIPGFRYIVPYIDDEVMKKELTAAKEAADFTAVFVHWGTEYSFEPNAEQRRVAKLLAENGAGIIIGHHSHTIQPIEYIPDGNGGEVLCAYSLGTLVSNMAEDRNMLAGFFSFEITKWDNGSVTVENPLFTPTVFYYNMMYRESQLLYLKDMTAALAASHGIGNYPKNSSVKNTMTVSRLYEYLNNTINDAFLPPEYRKGA